jgi:hypothetical protein
MSFFVVFVIRCNFVTPLVVYLRRGIFYFFVVVVKLAIFAHLLHTIFLIFIYEFNLNKLVTFIKLPFALFVKLKVLRKFKCFFNINLNLLLDYDLLKKRNYPVLIFCSSLNFHAIFIYFQYLCIFGIKLSQKFSKQLILMLSQVVF